MSLKQIAKDAHTKVLAYGGAETNIGILNDLAEQCGADDVFEFLDNLSTALDKEGLELAGGPGSHNEIYVKPKVG